MQITFKLTIVEPVHGGDSRRISCEVIHADPSIQEEAESMKRTMENSAKFAELLMEEGETTYLEKESEILSEACIYHKVKLYLLNVEMPKRKLLLRRQGGAPLVRQLQAS